jgi:hypothetical protein
VVSCTTSLMVVVAFGFGFFVLGMGLSSLFSSLVSSSVVGVVMKGSSFSGTS